MEGVGVSTLEPVVRLPANRIDASLTIAHALASRSAPLQRLMLHASSAWAQQAMYTAVERSIIGEHMCSYAEE